MNAKSNTQRTKKRRRRTVKQPVIRLATISPTMLFRAFIMFAALVVASIAILKGVNGIEIWSFLGSVVIYAALTQQIK